MSCMGALRSQLETILSAPREVLLLQHKVFREYARIAVGPDFVHTLPSIIILTAMAFVLWKHPPFNKWLFESVGLSAWYRIFQILVSWLVIDVVLWLWLIFQRVLYCGIWTSWSYESEHHRAPHQWWQRVWSSYYPSPLEPPVLSSDFISWIISMVLASMVLGCAVSSNQVCSFIAQRTVQSPENIPEERQRRSVSVASNVSSVHDECPSEISSEPCPQSRFEVHPISNGTNWKPRPNFSNGRKETQSRTSVKSAQTVAGVNDAHDQEKLPPRHFLPRRQCNSAVPCNSSNKSSGC